MSLGRGCSGSWRGFFRQYDTDYYFTMNLTFDNAGHFSGVCADDDDFAGKNADVSGSWTDDGGVTFTKQYRGKHSVGYEGQVDGSTISGFYFNDPDNYFQMTLQSYGKAFN